MTTSTSAGSRATYHHGALREALIAATVALVEERGAEGVTVREAARRAGVSSGAPFRHFPTRTALMTAVAEEGMKKLAEAVDAGLAALATDDPFARLAAIGRAYFGWAVANPTHYRVIGDRPGIDFEGSEILSGRAAAIRAEMGGIFADARARGLLRDGDLALIHLQARALAYGLARMHVDAHLKEWAIPPERAQASMQAVMEDYLAGLARDPAAAHAAMRRSAQR